MVLSQKTHNPPKNWQVGEPSSTRGLYVDYATIFEHDLRPFFWPPLLHPAPLPRPHETAKKVFPRLGPIYKLTVGH